MAFSKVIGLGWDVGGWMGNNHGVAMCQWDRRTNEISWSGKAAEISIPDRGLLTLDHLISEVDPSFRLEAVDSDTLVIIGIDAPLGYPAAFNRLINGERPEMKKPEKEIFNPLAYRFTDQEIYRVFGKKPLSASYDRIGNNATAAMIHTKRWEEEAGFKTLPLKEASDTDHRLIIEVYPALVKEKRFEEAHTYLTRFLPEDTSPGTDAYDASLCALFAVAFGSNGKVLPKIKHPPKEKNALIKEEGWIYYFDQSST
ncbi:DUF429 domain-containing protein [Jeotgalibacillus proteolyticus]|uniref:DUF429 domain-containing protein n=1 Tax=Jeotgalibacillus proteolyticus TaxID=2082395 RepID=A0A2S5G7W4_9BACL|nr:DUF429 domain-containing protein [Jeotgalibacillus proteolyticus]PPA69087.1 hypothetical protein C4B60_17390 [Jeotgalibacillus proteolyticus]